MRALLVDNTTATPLGQQPLSLGADLVVASATKALSGHSDLLAGYVAGSHPELMAALERERLLTGAILGSFEAWLVLRSLGSVGLRFERQCQNALALAPMLREPSGGAVGALPGSAGGSVPPGGVAVRCASSAGWSASNSPTPPPSTTWCERSELLVASTSFGGLHTSVDRRARWGDPVPAGFARISVGIEDTDDLVADVLGALDRG